MPTGCAMIRIRDVHGVGYNMRLWHLASW